MSGANVVIDESQKHWRRDISQLEWEIAMGLRPAPAGYERAWSVGRVESQSMVKRVAAQTLPKGGPSTTPTPRARKPRRSLYSLSAPATKT